MHSHLCILNHYICMHASVTHSLTQPTITTAETHFHIYPYNITPVLRSNILDIISAGGAASYLELADRIVVVLTFGVSSSRKTSPRDTKFHITRHTIQALELLRGSLKSKQN
jgi:hypothetical protein